MHLTVTFKKQQCL